MSAPSVAPRRLSARAFWGLASWALPLGVVFVVSPKLLHLLGAERFGILMVVLVTPLMASQLDLGISSTAVRRLADILRTEPIKASTTLLTLFVALSAVGVALGVALWLAARPVSTWLGFEQVLGAYEGHELVRLSAAWAAISLPALVPGLVARSAQALQLATVVQTVSTVALWLGTWLLLGHGTHLTGVVGLGICLTLLSASITLLALGRLVAWTGRPALELESLQRSARFSLGMFAAQTAGAIVYQGDRVLVASLGSPAIAGLYALCANIANKTTAAIVAIHSFVLPHAAGLESAGRRDATIGLVHALQRAVSILLIPLLAPALLLAEPFLQLWLGSYSTPELVLAFRILMIAFAVPAFALPVSNVLVASGAAGLAARFAWLTVVVVVVALFSLVPKFGLIGAAASMLLGNSTSLIFTAFARRALQVPSMPDGRRLIGGLALGVAVQCAVLGLVVMHVTDWITLLGLGALSWAACFFARAAVHALSPEERELLRRLSRAGRGP